MEMTISRRHEKVLLENSFFISLDFYSDFYSNFYSDFYRGFPGVSSSTISNMPPPRGDDPDLGLWPVTEGKELSWSLGEVAIVCGQHRSNNDFHGRLLHVVRYLFL